MRFDGKVALVTGASRGIGIETDMSSQLPPESRTYALDGSALHRIGVPEDVADAILFFASDYSRHVSGQMILVDGGLAMP